MQKSTPTLAQPLWFAALLLASMGISFGFACAVPLAALAALGVLTLGRRTALLLILVVVAANQAVGFGILHYPRDAVTIAWGGAFLLVGVLAVFAADLTRKAVTALPAAGFYTLIFAAAFAAYEGGLFLLTLATSSDLYPYTAANVAHVLAINATTFVGLLVAGRLAAGADFAGASRRLSRRDA